MTQWTRPQNQHNWKIMTPQKVDFLTNLPITLVNIIAYLHTNTPDPQRNQKKKEKHFKDQWENKMQRMKIMYLQRTFQTS